VRNPLFAAALATLLGSPLTFSQTAAPATAQPGILEAFLTATRNSSTREEALGKLASGGWAEATFEALVAWDPVFPNVTVKGLRVQLSEGVRRDVVYLDSDRDEEFDRDSLRDFQSEFSHLIADRDALFRGRPTGTVIAVVADNRTTPQGFVPRRNVFSVGWYSYGKRFGVVMESPRAGWFYFPGADLAQVQDFIGRGREFLQAH
jgi:hypothetical protein